MGDIEKILEKNGPARASVVARALQEECGLSAVAARKRISRISKPLFRFPVRLLPKSESFLYTGDQRKTERFWTNLHATLRETNSVYGVALDGLMARGGVVVTDEFPVISGAPLALKGQVSSERVARALEEAQAIKRETWIELGAVYACDRPEIGHADFGGLRSRMRVEAIMLDGLRKWAANLGLASFNKIAIRGENHSRQVGQFKWDLTGPSYLLPLRRGGSLNGFLVADVFCHDNLDLHSIQFFIRKVKMLRESSNSGDALAVLVARRFTSQALKAGHAAGLVLATPENLFGWKVGRAIESLVETLNNAAATAVANPVKLADLIDDLSEIEGAAGNLRGILFELIAAHLARIGSSSIDMGVAARDENGNVADIDVLKVCGKSECVGIECKGKRPGGVVAAEEVQDWLKRIPIFRSHLVKESRFREAKISFEFWTTGTFSPDALILLQKEKQARTKTPIDWKDGATVEDLAKTSKEKRLVDSLREHFLRHPLAQ